MAPVIVAPERDAVPGTSESNWNKPMNNAI